MSFIPFPPVALNDDPASADAAKIYVAPDSAEIMDQYEQYVRMLLLLSTNGC